MDKIYSEGRYKRMFSNHSFGTYMDNWRQAQKMLKQSEQLTPQEYGQLLINKRKRRKKNKCQR